MQMRIVVSHLVRMYRFTLAPNQDFRPVAVPTKMPKDGLVAGIEARTENWRVEQRLNAES
jgi:hypothetical protein